MIELAEADRPRNNRRHRASLLDEHFHLCFSALHDFWNAFLKGISFLEQ